MTLLRKSHHEESLRGGHLSGDEMVRGGFLTVDRESIKRSLVLALMFLFQALLEARAVDYLSREYTDQ